MDENNDLITKRNDLKRRMSPLAWDKKLNQINFARDLQLTAYKDELEKLEKEIAGEKNV